MKNPTVKVWGTILIIMTGFGCLLDSFYRPRIGSRSGRVVDAVTGEPVEGAVVNYLWKFGGFMGVVDERVAASYETITDKDGKYFIPSQRAERESYAVGHLHEEIVLIYKDNYATYTAWAHSKVGRSFGYSDKDQKYRKRNNLVKLYPWKDGESHLDHIHYIEWAPYHPGILLRQEMENERERADKEP
jgi:hypothetical protein